jgi:hypothetical protein
MFFEGIFLQPSAIEWVSAICFDLCVGVCDLCDLCVGVCDLCVFPENRPAGGSI